MIYTSSGRRYPSYAAMPGNYRIAESGTGFFGSMRGAGYLVAVLAGAVGSILLQGWLG